MLQLTLKLPANTTVSLGLHVAKSFLLYTEHPPDAQRGWDLPPAVVITGLNEDQPQRIYTPALLIDLATPDFSMPYNVIIMTCTLVALIFGTIFNILVRKFTFVNLQDTLAELVPDGR
jgi:GPI-anchor transamidase subunit T